jgi:hypothetical protein
MKENGWESDIESDTFLHTSLSPHCYIAFLSDLLLRLSAAGVSGGNSNRVIFQINFLPLISVPRIFTFLILPPASSHQLPLPKGFFDQRKFFSPIKGMK